jgi:hypothetical protein
MSDTSIETIKINGVDYGTRRPPHRRPAWSEAHRHR